MAQYKPSIHPPLICSGCDTVPSQLTEYQEEAKAEGITPDEFVWRYESTVNKANGHFLCTNCYLGWGLG